MYVTHFSVDDFVRIFLALYFSGIAFFYAQRLLFKAPPVKRIHPGQAFSNHWIGHALFRVFRALILVVCIARALELKVELGIDVYLGICPVLNVATVQLIGLAMLVIGFGVVLLAHFDLGDYWRSGVDPQGPEAIVTTGLYARSRNPIFTGVLLAQVGFFFALPGVFSLVCLLTGVLVIRNQVRLEERHLGQRGAEAYALYRQRVPRWV